MVLGLFTKVFFAKFGAVASFGVAKVSNPRRFSPRKLYFSLTRESFLPQKFPAIRYMYMKLDFFIAAHMTSILRKQNANTFFILTSLLVKYMYEF